MPGEVVRAKLVFRIKTFFLQIPRPFFKRRPVARGKVCIAFHLRDGTEETKQIAALFDRHLIIHAALAIAINLAVGLRIGAEVVRCERKFPALARGIIHERHDERLRQRGTEK